VETVGLKILLALGWRLPLIRGLSSRQPVTLMYHGVPAGGAGDFINGKIFEQHIRLLKKHFEFVSGGNAVEPRRALDKIRVLLTFDDGLANNAEVVAPILRKHTVPAVFFVCSRHAQKGKYLWFSYLRALESHFKGKGFFFREKFFEMSDGGRRLSIDRLREILLGLRPHPTAMYKAIEEELPQLEDFVSPEQLADCYAGMRAEQVAELAHDPLFSLGVHTVDHPFLTKCDPQEARSQILQNKIWIEQTIKQLCDTIAYPGGDYNSQILEQSLELGLIHGHAHIPNRITNTNQERPRIGVYTRSSEILGFKIQWGNLIRFLRIKAC
jgi:peptidoglycan/xylan/chitin deacetylase (PgdA/CDA1 family)